MRNLRGARSSTKFAPYLRSPPPAARCHVRCGKDAHVPPLAWQLQRASKERSASASCGRGREHAAQRSPLRAAGASLARVEVSRRSLMSACPSHVRGAKVIPIVISAEVGSADRKGRRAGTPCG